MKSNIRLATAFVAALTCGVTAHAAISGADYTVNVSPDALVLSYMDSPMFHDIMMEQSCDNPHLRTYASNKPAIMITAGSTLEASAQLSKFVLTINNSSYAFGTGDFATDHFSQFITQSVYSDAGVNIVGNTLSADKRTLTLDLTGLTAGKSVIFNVDLDTTDPSMFIYPDFRNVLSGAPLSAAASPTAVATYIATFTKAAESLNAPGSFAQDSAVPEFANQTTRPYNTMVMQPIISGGGGAPGVPEPASYLLLATAIAAGAATRRRRSA